MMKILIVEDSEKMRQVIKSFVVSLAEEVSECVDGSEALTAYEQHQPDWVLMDIMMKGMDGLAATRKIKASYPDARIVIVTSYDDVDLRAAARSAGACEYVTKDNLLKVRQILGSRTASC
jgi:two-component system, NarL family, response regulator LiaR